MKKDMVSAIAMLAFLYYATTAQAGISFFN